MPLLIWLVGVVLIFLIALIPSWIVMLAYNYLVVAAGHAAWGVPVTFWTVVCVAILVAFIRGLFSRK